MPEGWAPRSRKWRRAMLTRRHVLALTGAAMAVTSAARLAAQPIAPRPERNADMDIKRNGSQPSRKGAEEYFTGSARIDPLFQAPDPARTGAGQGPVSPRAPPAR